MKKMLIAIIVLLLIVIFLLLYCNCRKKCASVPPGKPADSCLVFCTDSVDRLQGMIDFNALARMSNDYARDPGKSKITGSGNPGKNDALSMVFDLKKIKTLIWQIEHYICRNHCDDRKLGIRYYYVKYPPEVGTSDAPASLQRIDPSERNKHALVMVPVYYDKVKKEWHDFDIWNYPTSCFHMFPIPGGTSGLPSLFGGVTGTEEGGDNHGGIGPPPDPGVFPSSNE